jgi:hypothetical protein
VQRRENWDWRDPDPATAPLMAPLVRTRCLSHSPQGIPSHGARSGGETSSTVGRRRKAGGLVSSPSGSDSVVSAGPAAPGLAREQSRLDEVERTAAPGRWTRQPESTPMLRPASSPPSACSLPPVGGEQCRHPGCRAPPRAQRQDGEGAGLAVGPTGSAPWLCRQRQERQFRHGKRNEGHPRPFPCRAETRPPMVICSACCPLASSSILPSPSMVAQRGAEEGVAGPRWRGDRGGRCGRRRSRLRRGSAAQWKAGRKRGGWTTHAARGRNERWRDPHTPMVPRQNHGGAEPRPATLPLESF